MQDLDKTWVNVQHTKEKVRVDTAVSSCPTTGLRASSIVLLVRKHLTKASQKSLKLTLLTSRQKEDHSNAHLSQLFRDIEHKYAKHADHRDVYDKTTGDVLLLQFKLAFPCNPHKEDILAKLLHYYVCLHMRQYCKQLRANS